jgi:DNA adenine methylase
MSGATSVRARPVLRWHGGKWRLAPWIISYFPRHRVYVEPFGGAASVLMRKKPAHAEVYNDPDNGVVNLFQILRDPEMAGELHRRLQLTPFARAEFQASYGTPNDEIETARYLTIRSYMGFGSNGHNAAVKTGFRANSNRSGTTPAHDWANYPRHIERFTERLRRVVIENRPADRVMATHDGPETLHYVDPPYLHSTRSARGRGGKGSLHAYAHEMDDAGHVGLLAAIRNLAGMVVLSGYPNDIYDKSLPGWRRIEKPSLADGARKRTEVLWLNPACVKALEASVPA